MKKLLNKKNNKGFSLVELIVVVLIMGIIAVALAPQVMKWVGTARTNSDENTAKDIKSAVQVALADWQQSSTLPASGTDYTCTINGTSTTLTDSTGYTGLSAMITEVMGGDYPKPAKTGSGGFVVTVSGGSGKVSVSY
ncbi:MAG: type II secretion system protein [Lachnospiraceae bacterium]|nr:type II secretion system protein [Lachnospiraceae bacterium]